MWPSKFFTYSQSCHLFPGNNQFWIGGFELDAKLLMYYYFNNVKGSGPFLLWLSCKFLGDPDRFKLWWQKNWEEIALCIPLLKDHCSFGAIVMQWEHSGSLYETDRLCVPIRWFIADPQGKGSIGFKLQNRIPLSNA